MGLRGPRASWGREAGRPCGGRRSDLRRAERNVTTLACDRRICIPSHQSIRMRTRSSARLSPTALPSLTLREGDSTLRCYVPLSVRKYCRGRRPRGLRCALRVSAPVKLPWGHRLYPSRIGRPSILVELAFHPKRPSPVQIHFTDPLRSKSVLRAILRALHTCLLLATEVRTAPNTQRGSEARFHTWHTVSHPWHTM